MFKQLLCQVGLSQLVKEILGIFPHVIVPLQVLGDDGAQESE